MKVRPLDLRQLQVLPLAQRDSLTRTAEVLIAPDAPPPSCPQPVMNQIRACAQAIRQARRQQKTVMLIYGAHLVRNGAAPIIGKLMALDWLTHLATNGAGTIHDWEYAWLGASTESVRAGVSAGTFGTWDETAKNIHLALMTGALDGLGYGQALGKFIVDDGTHLPDAGKLRADIANDPAHPLTGARAELLHGMKEQGWQGGKVSVEHRWKDASILALAYRRGVPTTVHPGIGYDIISNHPIFNGAVLGRAAEWDFKLFGGSVEKLDGGVVLSVGSAIMGPQVFEKSLSCVNNIRIKEGRDIVVGHSIFVVDLQDAGGWDWTQGDPPKTNPAYYLRFCKSYARMGGAMHYLQCDNAAFIHQLYHELIK
jgi:hypothetical protein